MIAGIAASISGSGICTAVFGGLGVAAVFVWPRLRSYQGAVTMQCAGAAAFAMYFALSGSSTASASCGLAIVQLLAASLVRDRRVVIFVCAASLSCLGLIAAWTWTGLPTVLASCGCLLSTFARMQATPHRMKIWFLLGAPFWLAHNLLTLSMFALAVDAVSIASNGASVVRSRSFTEDQKNVGIPLLILEICRVSGEFWQAARICISSPQPQPLAVL